MNLQDDSEADTGTIQCPARPLFSFGLIADIQYADLENKQNFEKTSWRYYRDSLRKLSAAIDEWNKTKHPVSFVLQLGDLIDGFNSKTKNSEKALDQCLDAFRKFKGQAGAHHTWGNHEYYNFSREFLLKSELNSSPVKVKAYYDFSPFPGSRFIVLDTYEFSLLGYPEDSPIYRQAEKLLRSVKADRDLNSPDGIEGVDTRYVMFNGAVSQLQLAWLDDVLMKAQNAGEWVIIMGHQPLYEPSTYCLSLMWNYPDILAVINKYSCVVAYISGHDHDGGYAIDDHGVHHVTMRGVIETPEGTKSHATAHVYRDHIEVRNIGSKVDVLEKVIMKLPQF